MQNLFAAQRLNKKNSRTPRRRRDRLALSFIILALTLAFFFFGNTSNQLNETKSKTAGVEPTFTSQEFAFSVQLPIPPKVQSINLVGSNGVSAPTTIYSVKDQGKTYSITINKLPSDFVVSNENNVLENSLSGPEKDYNATLLSSKLGTFLGYPSIQASLQTNDSAHRAVHQLVILKFNSNVKESFVIAATGVSEAEFSNLINSFRFTD